MRVRIENVALAGLSIGGLLGWALHTDVIAHAWNGASSSRRSRTAHVDASVILPDKGNPYTCADLTDPNNPAYVSAKYYQGDPNDPLRCITDTTDGSGSITHGQ